MENIFKKWPPLTNMCAVVKYETEILTIIIKFFVWKKSIVENLNVIVCDNHCGHNFVKEGKNGSVVTVSFPYVL